MQVVFSSLTLSFFIHSTEETELVTTAVAKSTGLEKGEISFEDLKGYHGNKMIIATVHIFGDRGNELAKRLLRRLEEASRKKLNFDIERSVDEHDNLYIRLDRQSLNNSLSLSDDEPIHIKLKPKFRTDRESMIRAYKELIV